MKNKLKRLARLFPLGWPWDNELIGAACAMGISALTALCLFAYRFNRAADSLYHGNGQERQLIPGAVMLPYPQVLGNAMILFGVTALCLALLTVVHYLWHRHGARSDYLMRRLPRRWELAKRCLAGSAVLLACTALAAAVLFGIFFIWYLCLTPAGCLPPDVWARTGG